jgi:hypothetical protein
VVLRLFNEELVYESRAILVIGSRRLCTSISLFHRYFNVLFGLCLLVSLGLLLLLVFSLAYSSLPNYIPKGNGSAHKSIPSYW